MWSNLFLLVLCLPGFLSQEYEASWESLDSRPLPSWYDEAKFGIFIHWGVFSVPSYFNEWFWYYWVDVQDAGILELMKNYPSTWTYQKFASQFTAEFFDATEWAELFAASGAKYVVLTSKHHEGYHMWPSKYAYSWNCKDVGPGRDIIGELSQAVRGQNLTFGVYHSLLEWYHPIYRSDKANNFQTQEFVDNKIIPEMKELVETYEPAILWSDGNWEGTDEYWKSKEFLTWLYNESPVKDVVVTNDRWGSNTGCEHGGFLSCNDRYNPGSLQTRKWENAMTIDSASWGFRRNAKLSNYYTTLDLISQLMSTIAYGGNLLLNVGPTKDGIITPVYEERLREIGRWLGINGEAVYGSSPWTVAQNDSLAWGVWYTTKDTTLYATILYWPNGMITLGSVAEKFSDSGTTVVLLGNEDDGNLEWTLDGEKVTIVFPDKATAKSEWAYTLKIQPGGSLKKL